MYLRTLIWRERENRKKWTGLLSDLRILLLLISSCYTPLLPSEIALCYGLALIKKWSLWLYPQSPHGWFQGLRGEKQNKRTGYIDLARQAWLGWFYINDDYDESLLYGVHAAELGWGGRWTGLLSFCRFLSLVCCFPNGVPRFYFFFSPDLAVIALLPYSCFPFLFYFISPRC